MCTDASGSLWASGSFWSLRKLWEPLGASGREPLEGSLWEGAFGSPGSLRETLGVWKLQGASESFRELLGICAGFWKPPGPADHVIVLHRPGSP